MTEAEWLACENPAAMLSLWRSPCCGCLWRDNGNNVVSLLPGAKPCGRCDNGPTNPVPLLSSRKLRLFAVALARQVWDGRECEVDCDECGGSGEIGVHEQNATTGRWRIRKCRPCKGTGRVPGRVGGLTDERSRRAVETAERYADGEATEEELRSADEEIVMHAEAGGYYDQLALWVTHATTSSLMMQQVLTHSRGMGVPPATQAQLLRCIAGDPFNPVRLVEVRHRTRQAPEISSTAYTTDTVQQLLPWLTPTVRDLAAAIYAGRQWDGLGPLADALEEAGCTEAALLQHLRSPGPHCRGCHVIDCITGKE